MVRVEYNKRILVDKEFVQWLINRSDREKYFIRLTHIKASSKEHKKKHNVMVEEEYQEVLSEKIIKDVNLGSAFKQIKMPEIISVVLKNPIDQKIILAMVLANEKPYRTVIFTTKEKLLEYESSPHYLKVKSVSVKANEDALTIIDSFFTLFSSEKDLYRQ